MTKAKAESFHTGVFYMLLSATAMAALGFLGKVGTRDLPVEALLFWRFFVASILFSLFLALQGAFRRGIYIGHVKAQSIRALFVLGAQVGFYYYVQQGTLLNGLILLNTGPIFVTLIAWAILRQKVGKSSWIAVAISFLGVILTIQPDKEVFQAISWIGLGAGLCQGISQILFGMSAGQDNREMGTLFLLLFCALGSFVLYFVSGDFATGAELGSFWTIGLVLLLGIFSILNQAARSAAYENSTPGKLSAFLYFAVPIAGFLDWWFFHNVPNALSLVGICLVIGGGILKIYVRNLILRKRK